MEAEQKSPKRSDKMHLQNDHKITYEVETVVLEVDFDSEKEDEVQLADLKKEESNIQAVGNLHSTVQREVLNIELNSGDNESELAKHIGLRKALNGHEFKLNFERPLNAPMMTRDIEKWLNTFVCSYKGCSHRASMAYTVKSSYQILCEVHGNSIKQSETPIIFINQLGEIKTTVNQLEKKLIFVQKQIAYFKSWACDSHPIIYEELLMKIKGNYDLIKSKVASIIHRTEVIVSQANDLKNLKNNPCFESLAFINEEGGKCSTIASEILSTIDAILINQNTDYLIHILVNVSRGIGIDEESKFESYLEVPEEVYQTEYTLTEIPLQSLALLQRYEDTLTRGFEDIKTYQKVRLQI